MVTGDSRSNQMLALLAAASEPIPVTQLADRLAVSRRTIFRELNAATQVLSDFGLTLDTIAGKGVWLAGDEGAVASLAAQLADVECITTKVNRLPNLAILLADAAPAAIKLSKLSGQLGLSDPTVLAELDKLKVRLRDFEVELIRKQGVGIYLKGAELAFRQVLSWAMSQLGQSSFDTPPELLELAVQLTPESFTAVQRLCVDINALLSRYCAIAVETEASITDLAKLAGFRFGDGPELGKQIFQALVEREKLATQVVSELGIVLLHSRVAGLETPIFALLHPMAKTFTHPEMRNTRAAVLILAPQLGSVGQGELLGEISASLVDNESFLAAIQAHDSETTYDYLQLILQNFLDKQSVKG